ncbi:MAG: hypothetical protein K9M49_02620 [Candidatus Marinimicrobia bacterium]|nr:hypothetical protein [Candidatus Neomarinimicrobiota bacterium]MCF7851057.1 hypothetical protein [Candidatus Neomarinimicrobiota bacterium]MCF7904027.1 hypothetical protein [Candidatus Neomarinimicrobiota bacterium]
MIQGQTRGAITRILLFSVSLIAISSCILAPDLRTDFGLTEEEQLAQLTSTGETSSFNDFITSIYQAAPEDKQALVDSFIHWADSTSGIPYIEDSTVYFLYAAGNASKVHVAGDFNGWAPGNAFNSVSGTNFFYRAYTFEMDARLDYKLVVDDAWILDPLNPNTCAGGYGPNSELSLPDYIQPPEIQEYDIPHGALNQTSFSDSIQGRTRNITIYTPPGYEAGMLSYRSIYFLDGTEALQLGFAANVLDYLIHEALIPPVIAVFSDPTNRNSEYAYDMDFMDMFVSELVPWIDETYRTMPEPRNRAITGVSLGGLTSLLFTLNHPEVFGNCGAYSPAIWLGDLIGDYQNSPKQDTKIYMDAGTYEQSIHAASMDLKQILDSKDWDYKWKVWHEGHSWGAWRAHLDESLTYFWPMHTTGIDERY